MVVYQPIKGFSLIEPLLAGSVLALLALGIISGVVLAGEQSGRLVGERQALFLSNEGLEAVRSIGDADFSQLAAGSYGLQSSDGHWAFVPESDTSDAYTRTVVMSDESTGVKNVASIVLWTDASGARSVVLETELADWR